MYIHITTKCNMRCAHCCMSCEPGKGVDMGLGTFRKALKVAGHHGEYVTLGGGEPTVHPRFEQFLFEAIGAPGVDGVWVITNGKHKRRALMLAKLNGVLNGFGAELSTDHYHEPVDTEVFDAFRGRHRDVIRGGREPLAVGRGQDEVGMTFEEADPDCPCVDWSVMPDGTILQCGCPNAPVVGNVNDGILPMYSYAASMCYRSEEFQEAIKEYLNNLFEPVTGAKYECVPVLA